MDFTIKMNALERTKGMQPLYEADTTFDYIGFRNLSIAVERHKKFNWSIMLAFEFVTIMMTIYYLVSIQNRQMGIAFLAIALLFPIGMILRVLLDIKSKYKKQSNLEGLVIHFSFYENYFEASSSKGHSRNQYDSLSRIIVTWKNIFLMDSDNRAFILDKSMCSDELTMFLGDMANKKRPRGPLSKVTLG